LGIPAITAHRAVHAGGPIAGCHVLVQGGAGGVGSFAVCFARQAGADVIATVRSSADAEAARHDVDEHVLALGGSIAAYATDHARSALPFWNLLFKNARLYLLGSDDFPIEHKLAAACDVNELLAQGWRGVRIDRAFSLAHIAAAHEHAESRPRGRVVLRV
jgi:NADPH2:quinone reductase